MSDIDFSRIAPTRLPDVLRGMPKAECDRIAREYLALAGLAHAAEPQESHLHRSVSQRPCLDELTLDPIELALHVVDDRAGLHRVRQHVPRVGLDLELAARAGVLAQHGDGVAQVVVRGGASRCNC